MWTPAARAQLARNAFPYATSLTDREWALVAPFLPPPTRTGRPWKWPMRLIVDAILYALRAGGAWHLLPREFPPWGTVYRWFARLAHTGMLERLAHALTVLDRECAGREASPTAAVIDAQCVRSGGVGVAGQRAYDAAKKVVGRKRHAMVDTDGRLLIITASTAGVHDSHGAVALLPASRRPWPFIERCYADKAYAGRRVANASPITVELVGAAPGQRGFAVQPRRWVIERTFAWIGRCRRLNPPSRGHRLVRCRLHHSRRRHDPRQAARESIMKRVLRNSPPAASSTAAAATTISRSQTHRRSYRGATTSIQARGRQLATPTTSTT